MDRLYVCQYVTLFFFLLSFFYIQNVDTNQVKDKYF